MMRIRSASKRPSRRDQSGGYILLALIFGAAIVAIGLALSLPRAAMRAQRIREERLIYRGEQYKRAIRLYFRELKKYPENLDDLEDTNGVRYLRRRYKDPITGEDEWRIIHMGTNGRFKDSILYDTEEEEDPVRGGSMGGLRPSGSRPPVSTGPPPTGYFAGGDRALARRESAAANPYDNRGPYASQEALAGIEPGEGQQQGAEDGQQQPAPDFSGVQPGQVPLDAGQRQPRRPGEAAAPVQPAPRTRQRAGFGSAGSIGGFGSQRQQQVPPSGGQPAGFGRQGVGPQASNIIQRLLTTPRPGGLQGLQQQNAAMANQPAAFPEGIAGVASKAEDHGVRVYRGKENYNEWEFVYDYREEEGLEGIVGGAAGGGLAPGQPGTSASGILGGAATQGGGIVPAGVSAPIPGQAAPAGFPGQPQNPNDPRGGFGRQGPSIFYPPTAPIGAPGGGPYPGQPPVQPGPGTPPEPNPTTPQTQPNNRTGRRLPNSRFGGQTYPNQPQPQR